MLRSLLVLSITLALLALPGAVARAAILPTVSAGTLTVTGDGAADRVALRLAPGAPQTLQVDAGADGSADFAFDRATFSRIAVRSGAGADDVRVDEANGAFTDTETTTIESGAGADVVTGGRGAEAISAGDDADLVFGGPGDDALFLGAGDDTAIQGPDDGSDTLEGQAGTDMLQALGSEESEEFTVQAVAARVRLTRDVAPGNADLAGVETLDLSAGGGGDLVDVGSLAGTELTTVDADLGLADGARDSVFAAGTAAKDSVGLSAAGDVARVSGLSAQVRVANARAADDRLTVQAGDGDDTVAATGSAGGLLALRLEGNAGNDSLTGGSAAETFDAGPGDDTVRGRQGADAVELGDGLDTAVWSPGDGDDAVEGGAGFDHQRVLATSGDDRVDLTAAGPRVQVESGAGGRLSLGDVEQVDPQAGAGADTLAVGDLTGTPLRFVATDLAAGEPRTDTVIVDGTPGADELTAVRSGTLTVIGAAGPTLLVDHAELFDKLFVDGHGGDDEIDVSLLTKDQLQPILDGGAGKDTIVGSPGQDAIAGGPGDDVALMGGGLDTFDWEPGDGSDIVEGQAGTDFLHMDGSAAAERFDVSSAGARTRVTRDVESVDVDLGGVERLDVNPAAGADTIHVADLSGTAVTNVDWELAPFRGTTATDGSPDSVVIDGTNGNDAIGVAAAGQQVRVTGLAATVTTNRSDKLLDALRIDTKAGNDVLSVDPRVKDLIGFSST